jgi:hypothetical protein
MGDPFIQRTPDGSFRMVRTLGWYKPLGSGYSESKAEYDRLAALSPAFALQAGTK